MSAPRPAAALLLAAAHLGQGIGWAVQAVARLDGDDDTPTWVEAVAVLTDADLGRPQADALAALLVAEDRLRQSVTATMEVALGPWRRAGVLAPDATSWHPELLAGGGTLYVIAPGSGVAVGAAVAVVDQLIRHWRAATTGRRVLAPLLAVIDEAANTAPLPDLPTLVTESRGLGVHLVVAVQHTDQLRLRWGEAGGDVLRRAFPAVLLLHGAWERALLEDAAWAQGATETWSASLAAAHGHRTHEMTPSTSPAGLLPPDTDHGRLLLDHAMPRLVAVPDISTIPGLRC